MSEDNVTSGTVSFEDAIKVNTGGDPQYWPTRRAKAELTFDVFEGQDADEVFNRISAKAKAKVHEMLGKASAAAIAAATAPAAQPAAAEAERPTRTRRTQAQIAADEAAKASPTISSVSQGSDASPQPSADAAPTAASPSPAAPAAEAATASAASGDDEWDVGDAPPEVSDADLNAACSATAERIKNPVAVRETIVKFAPKDLPEGTKWKITQLEGAAARTLFLDALKALQPAA